MKRKKNIIKKIGLNKSFKLFYKKEFKHYFKESRLKNKFFFKILFFIKSFNKINKISKYYRFTNLNINNNFLIKRYSYFNFITNGLDLKYNNLFDDLNSLNYLNSNVNRKIIILKQDNSDFIKYQKFINLLDNNCVAVDITCFTSTDLFTSTSNLYYLFLLNIYILNYTLILINKFF